MTADLGEVARLIDLIQLRTGLGLEGLRAACQRTARCRGRNLSAIFQLISDLKVHQRVGAPLGIQIQVFGNGHGEVECLLNVVLLVEPANELVAAILRVLRLFNEVAVIHRPSVDRFTRHCVLGQESLNRVLYRYPLGINHNLGSRHFFCPVNRLSTTRVGIPSAEFVSVFLQGARKPRLIAVFVVYRFGQHLLKRKLLGNRRSILVIEHQVILISSVIELCPIISVAIFCTHRSINGKSLYVVAFFITYN